MSKLLRISRVSVPSLRHVVKLDKSSLLKSNYVGKLLTEKKNSAYGRSGTYGYITSWHRQRGAKRLYRRIDASDETKSAIVIGVSYDPNRNAYISLCFDLEKKIFFNSLCTTNVYAGAIIQTSPTLPELKLGYRTQLSKVPTGSIVCNLSLPNAQKATYIKAAGTFGQLIQSGLTTSKVRLPSNRVIEVPNGSYATLGAVSNDKANLVVLGKAGRSRNLGRRPIVRGIAMNPVDHPHGGRTNGGRPSCSPWGLPTKGGFKLKRRSKMLKKKQQRAA